MRRFIKKTATKAVGNGFFTNLALGSVLISIGFACLYPSSTDIYVDGVNENVFRSGKSSNGVSLMFNVYCGTEYLDGILDTLQRHGAFATFFVGGSWADDHPEMLHKILSYGNELGNHGYFHRDHALLDEESNRHEMKVCNDYVRLVTGVDIRLFAPPSGSYGETAVSVATALGMKTILWSKDTIDWRDKNAALIYTRATKNVQGGDFILMHPVKETADALDDILIYYTKKGFSAITVSKNLSGDG